MLTDRPFSLGVAIDLLAGAIDVWLHPSATLAAESAHATHTNGEDKTMLSRVLRLDCAASSGMTRAEQWKSGVEIIVVTLALTGVWMWLHFAYPHNQIVEGLSPLAFLAPPLLTMRYTSLRGRPASVQAVFIGSVLVVVTAILLGASWIASRL